jgi:simple sugar transport system permease protein
LGSLLGAVIIQAVNTGILTSGFPPEYNLIIKAVIIVTILIIQSPRIGDISAVFKKSPSNSSADKGQA